MVVVGNVGHEHCKWVFCTIMFTDRMDSGFLAYLSNEQVVDEKLVQE